VSLRPVVIAAAAVLLFGGCAALASGGSVERETGIDAVQTYPDLSRDHVQPPVEYPQTPPVGGAHVATWVACNGAIYAAPVFDEEAVHALEHGAVWITYDESVDEAEVEALVALTEGVDYRFLSPYPGQPDPIMLTAWGLQLGVDSAADPRVAAFLDSYTNGPQTPEPGASCEAPSGEMAQAA
jgi:hypothetical protein